MGLFFNDKIWFETKVETIARKYSPTNIKNLTIDGLLHIKVEMFYL